MTFDTGVDLVGIQVLNHRRLRCKQKGRVVDVGSRLADDIKEFGHEVEEVDSSVGKRADINE